MKVLLKAKPERLNFPKVKIQYLEQHKMKTAFGKQNTSAQTCLLIVRYAKKPEGCK
jgi:hypothetical protein